MGCSAGKTLSTSPEISTSTQHTSLPTGNITKLENKNGLAKNGLVDEKSTSKAISSPKANINLAFRKDSTSSTGSNNSLDTAEKCLDTLPDYKQTKPKTQQLEQQKQKENDNQPKKLVNTKNRSEDDKPQVKSIPLGQVKVLLTQSQADFFTMLDKKIEEGEDYKSDCER